MTANEKRSEQERTSETGDTSTKTAGKPITEPKDNAQYHAQEKQTVSKAMRLTQGENAFEIGLSDGKTVQDQRPIRIASSEIGAINGLRGQAPENEEHTHVHKNDDTTPYKTTTLHNRIVGVECTNGDHVSIEYGVDGKVREVRKSCQDGTEITYFESGGQWHRTVSKDGKQISDIDLPGCNVMVAPEGGPGAGQVDVTYGSGKSSRHDSLKTDGRNDLD